MNSVVIDKEHIKPHVTVEETASGWNLEDVSKSGSWVGEVIEN